MATNFDLEKFKKHIQRILTKLSDEPLPLKSKTESEIRLDKYLIARELNINFEHLLQTIPEKSFEYRAQRAVELFVKKANENYASEFQEHANKLEYLLATLETQSYEEFESEFKTIEEFMEGRKRKPGELIPFSNGKLK